MKELIEFMKDDSNRNHYLDRTRPILMEDVHGDEYSIFKPLGLLDYIKYWLNEKKQIEIKVKEIRADHEDHMKLDHALAPINKQLHVLSDIIENLPRYLEDLSSHIFSKRFSDIQRVNFTSLWASLGIKKVMRSQKQEEEDQALLTIWREIKKLAPDDPLEPEFPPDNPHFPATDSYELATDEGRKIILKDESSNPTGTHKDRMAWEVVRYYQELIKARKNASIDFKLPQMSLIISGCAGIAIQSMLKRFNLPNLKVLIDHNLLESIKKALKFLGCEVYEINLSLKQLNSKEILEQTNNYHGIDLTDRAFLDPNRVKYYDWLSFEILNNDADYFFVPFGTGDLFNNLLSVTQRLTIGGLSAEPRFQRINKDIDFSQFCFFGATTNNPKSKMDKLYATYNPHGERVRRNLKSWVSIGACNPKSSVVNVSDEYVDLALEFARDHNIKTEASGIAGLALFMQQEKDIPNTAKVCVVNTGYTKYPIM
jgi:hypothetical protein